MFRESCGRRAGDSNSSPKSRRRRRLRISIDESIGFCSFRMRGEDSQSRMVALHRKGRGVAPSRSTRRSIHWRLSFAVAAFVLIALTFTLTAGNSKPHKTAAFTLAAEPESTLTAITDTSQQQFSNQLTDLSCGENDFTADPASTINVTVTADNGDERRDGQPRVPGNDRAERGQRCRPGDLRLLRFGYRGRHVHRAGLQVRQPGDALHAGGRAYPYTGIYSDVDASAQNPFAPPGSTTNPVTVTPVASYGNWNAKFAAATVVDPQRTEGEPLLSVDRDGTIWESGPWGFSTNQSFVHRSTNDGQEFHLVSAIGARPDSPPGGGDTDIAYDDQGNVYFTDLEGALDELGVSVSHDNGMNWTKNPAAVQQSVVDRQWLAVDNGASTSSIDNTIFLAFHETLVGTFIYSSPGSTGATDPSRRARLPELRRSPGRAATARRRRDLREAPLRSGHAKPLLRCDEGNHIRVTVGHVAPDSAPASSTRTTTRRARRRRLGAEPLPVARHRQGGQRLRRVDRQDELQRLLLVLDGSGQELVGAGAREQQRLGHERVRLGRGGQHGPALARVVRHAEDCGRRLRRHAELARRLRAPRPRTRGTATRLSSRDANTAKPQILQTRFTSKPMHYGAICNSGTACATDLSADRQMADFFGFGSRRTAASGSCTTTRRTNSTAPGSSSRGRSRDRPSGDEPRRKAGGRSRKRLDRRRAVPALLATRRRTEPAAARRHRPEGSNPTPTTLRFQITVADLSQLTPPPGKTTPLWLVASRRSARWPARRRTSTTSTTCTCRGRREPFRSSTAVSLPARRRRPRAARSSSTAATRPSTGRSTGTRSRSTPGLNTGFGVPVDGSTLYNVTAFTFGRNDSFDDLYADVDATQPFDYPLGSVKG